jgi:hypothetical protein
VLFDPQPTGDTTRKIRSTPNANRRPRFLLEVLAHIARMNKKITKPQIRGGSLRLGLIHGSLGLNSAAPEVKIVIVETADAGVLGVTELGEKEQAAPGGSPDEHVSNTGFEKAPWAVGVVAIE